MSEKIKRLSTLLAVMLILTLCVIGVLFVWDLVSEQTAREATLSSLWTFAFFYLASALVVVLTERKNK